MNLHRSLVDDAREVGRYGRRHLARKRAFLGGRARLRQPDGRLVAVLDDLLRQPVEPLRRATDVAPARPRRDDLPEGLDFDTAVDVLYAVGSPETYRLLVVDRGWSASRFARWYGETLERLLLRAVG